MARSNSGLRALTPYLPFLPFCAGVFLGAADQTVIVTVLPEVMADLEVSVSELDRASWAITGYLIGYTAAMPLMGRVSDRYGRKAMFVAALLVFIAGSIAVAISPELPRLFGYSDPDFKWLVGARVFQAIGGGALIPVAIAAAGDLVADNRRAVAFGLIGASAEAGGVVGPLWGGAITNLISWQWAFWLQIPVGIAITILVLRTTTGRRQPVRIDLLGGVLFAAALALITIGLARTAEPGPVTAWFLAAGAVAGALAVWRQMKAESPLLPRALLRIWSFRNANVAHFLVGGALIIGMVTVPLMADTVLNASPLEGGLRLLRMTIAISAGALLGGILTQRLGARIPALAGVALTGSGFLLMSRWGLDVTEPWMTIHLAVTGLGLGLLIAPITESALRRSTSADRGAGSALLTVSRMVGMTVGLAALTAWGTARYQLLAGGLEFSLDPVGQAAFEEGAVDAGLTVFRGFFAAAAAVAFATLPFVLLMTRHSPGSESARCPPARNTRSSNTRNT